MMAIWLQVSLALLLFLLSYIAVSRLLRFTVTVSRTKSRLHYVEHGGWNRRLGAVARKYRPLAAHIEELLEAVQFRTSIVGFATVTCMLLLFGVVIGIFFFVSVKGVVLCGGMLGSLPYVLLRMKLAGNQWKGRLDFLPAAEAFYQCYLLSYHKNVRTALHQALEGNRIRYPLYPVFEQLHRNLSTRRDPEESFRVFSKALGHDWAGYFTDMLRIGISEGVDLSDNLKELITDMRKAQRADQLERNRMLEIRIANFSPVLFLGLFLGINFRMNGENAYYYYLVDPAGRNMLLDSFLLIFASLFMGIYLSMKRM